LIDEANQQTIVI